MGEGSRALEPNRSQDCNENTSERRACPNFDVSSQGLFGLGAPVDILAGGSGGSSIDDYDVIRPIGKGKFAVVYRAARRADDVTVALKRISFDNADDKAKKKCIKEVRLLQSVDHPNVIRYLDSFLDNADLVIAFEWAAAGDLKRQIRKALERGRHFEERVIWGYFVQICAAISYMHEQRIMHRDIKPANIFLTLKGQVKVGDLGLGRFMSANTMEAHSKVGTPLYMSPEVLRGGGYGWKSDVWSLGCVLYELAMLKSPFKSEGLNLYSLFQKISNGDYPPVLKYYSPELRSLARDMIGRDPKDRPGMDQIYLMAQEMGQRTQLATESQPPPETAAHLKAGSKTVNAPRQQPSAETAAAIEGTHARADQGTVRKLAGHSAERAHVVADPGRGRTDSGFADSVNNDRRRHELRVDGTTHTGRDSAGSDGISRRGDALFGVPGDTDTPVEDIATGARSQDRARRRQRQRQRNCKRQGSGDRTQARTQRVSRSKGSRAGSSACHNSESSSTSSTHAGVGAHVANASASNLPPERAPKRRQERQRAIVDAVTRPQISAMPFAFDKTAPQDSRQPKTGAPVEISSETRRQGTHVTVGSGDATPIMTVATADARWCRNITLSTSLPQPKASSLSRSSPASTRNVCSNRWSTSPSKAVVPPGAQSHAFSHASDRDDDDGSGSEHATSQSGETEGEATTSGDGALFDHYCPGRRRGDGATVVPSSLGCSRCQPVDVHANVGQSGLIAADLADHTRGGKLGFRPGETAWGMAITPPRCADKRPLATGDSTTARMDCTSSGRATDLAGQDLVAADALHDLLCVLRYGDSLRELGKPPLSRLHFAVAGGGARKNSCLLHITPRQQFHDFATLSRWLLKGMTFDGHTRARLREWSSSDAPVSICATILEASQAAGFRSRKGSAVSPASLAPGCGPDVLEILNWLAETALNAGVAGGIRRRELLEADAPPAMEQSDGAISTRSFTSTLAHANRNGRSGSNKDDSHRTTRGRSTRVQASNAGDTEDELPEDLSMELSQPASEALAYQASSSTFARSSGDQIASIPHVVGSTVDPLAWRLELERVAPKLLKATRTSGPCSRVNRLNVLRAAAAGVTATTVTLPETRHLTGVLSASISGGNRGTATPEAILGEVQADVAEQMEAVTKGERNINARGDVRELQEQVLSLKHQEDESRAQIRRRQRNTEALKEELIRVSDAAHEVNTKIRDWTEACSDSTRLFKTKIAVRRLKAELKAMDVLVGARSAALLGEQMKRQRLERTPIEVEEGPVRGYWSCLGSPTKSGPHRSLATTGRGDHSSTPRPEQHRRCAQASRSSPTGHTRRPKAASLRRSCATGSAPCPGAAGRRRLWAAAGTPLVNVGSRVVSGIAKHRTWAGAMSGEALAKAMSHGHTVPKRGWSSEARDGAGGSGVADNGSVHGATAAAW